MVTYSSDLPLHAHRQGTAEGVQCRDDDASDTNLERSKCERGYDVAEVFFAVLLLQFVSDTFQPFGNEPGFKVTLCNVCWEYGGLLNLPL